MPESVISFPVDDGAFKAFADLYNKFQDAVKKLPSEWDEVNKSINSGTAQLSRLMSGLLVQNEILKETRDIHKNIAALQEQEINEAQQDRAANRQREAAKAAEEAARKQAQYWRDMASSAGHFAVQIKDATLSLFKWVGLTGIVSDRKSVV